MGNTESTSGLKMCSGNSLYTYANRNSLKEQMNVQQRVGYSHAKKQLSMTIPGPQYRKQASQQQFGQSQRQQQQHYKKEEPIELQVIEASSQQTQEEQEPVKEKTFKVYVECVKDQIAEDVELPALEASTDRLEKDMLDRKMQCFEGLFGNVIIHDNGLVLYTDINGEKFCEDFEASNLVKTFPLGISGGALSKSIWFNDIIERDNVYDAMRLRYNSVWSAQLKDISPPSYNEVVAQPEKYVTPEETEASLSYTLADALDTTEDEGESDNPDDHVKVFEGLGGMQVIVHEDNIVLFTDINGEKHCRPYNPHRLTKVFPSGISGGNLTKSIWFDDGQERDLCFALMQWNKDEVDEAEMEEPDQELKEYVGLYGMVNLDQDGQIEYTSLTGQYIKTYFEPDDIAPTFPMGISYGGLPKTIWFETHDDRQQALKAMRNM